MFSERQEGSTVSSIICERWWHIKIVATECHRGWTSVKLRMSHVVADLARLGWTAPRPEARQAEVTWEPAWLVGITWHLLGLWAWASVCRNHMLPSGRKEVPYRASPNICQCHSHPCTSSTITRNKQTRCLIDT